MTPYREMKLPYFEPQKLMRVPHFTNVPLRLQIPMTVQVSKPIPARPSCCHALLIPQYYRTQSRPL